MFDQQMALSNVVAAPDRRVRSRAPHRLARREGERIRLLGQLMDKSMKMLNGGEACSILITFLLLVMAADALSAWLRRQVR